jgi:hypothetical protein
MDAFVYCWTDHKTNKLYVGSHKGSTDDGYVCSSKHMMVEYKKRPEDFTKQIIAEGKLDDIRKLETKILQAANVRIDEQFYNKHDNDGFFFEGWKQGEFSEEHRKNMSISASKRKRTPEHIQKLNEGRRNSKNSVEHNRKISEKNTGKKHTQETLDKLSKKLKGKISPNKGVKLGAQSNERRKNTSIAIKKWWAERKDSQHEIGG